MRTLFQRLLGAQNVFDTVPDKVPQPENNAGQIYPEESPFGFNGGFYYLQFNYTLQSIFPFFSGAA